jgi:hypothetical protein
MKKYLLTIIILLCIAFILVSYKISKVEFHKKFIGWKVEITANGSVTSGYCMAIINDRDEVWFVLQGDYTYWRALSQIDSIAVINSKQYSEGFANAVKKFRRIHPELID